MADRWHQLADAIQASNLPASDKSVYRYLLDRADYGTAEMPAKFTPKQAVIARKTSHSLRQVRYAIRHLERHKWLTAEGRTGPGKSRRYTLSAAPAATAPAACTYPERRQPGTRNGGNQTAGRRQPSTTVRRQPTAATPQVRQRFRLRGSEREGWGGSLNANLDPCAWCAGR